MVYVLWTVLLERRTARARSDTMLTGLGILAVWIALQVWVLPRLGVPT
jgi:hypothetical protein